MILPASTYPSPSSALFWSATRRLLTNRYLYAKSMLGDDVADRQVLDRTNLQNAWLGLVNESKLQTLAVARTAQQEALAEQRPSCKLLRPRLLGPLT